MSVISGFVTSFNAPVLSSEVGDIRYVSIAGRAIFALKYASDIIMRASVFADKDGVCTLYQLDDVITSWMQENKVSYASFTIEEQVASHSLSFSVLLSSAVFSDKYSSLSKKPLVSYPSSVIPHDGLAFMHFISGSSPQITASVTGALEDGSLATCEYSLTSSVKDSVIRTIRISPEDIIDEINADKPVASKLSRILSVDVMARSASSVFQYSALVIDDPDFICFGFLNSFGLMEYLYLHAVVTRDLKLESEDAEIGHSLVPYDIESSQSFTVNVDNISIPDFKRILHFIISKHIADDSGREILISIDSMQNPEVYGSLGSLKFNYRYADTRIILD